MRSFMMILGLLFIAQSSFAQKAEVLLEVAEGAPLTVECPLRVEQRAAWRRDGGELPADLRPAGEAAAGPAGGGAGAVTARLRAAAARVHHAGLYTCARGADAARVRVRVRATHPAPALASEASVAEPPTSAPLTIAPRADEPADEPAEWLDYKYELGRTIELSCKPGGGAEAPPNIFKWKANGTDVAQVASLANRYKLTEGDAVLVVERATEDDWGNFTCTLSGKVVARGYRVRARPVLRLPADSNVVEGQKQKLTCRVFGRPYPVVTWTYAAALGDHENQTNVVDRLGDRGLVQASAAGVEGAELVIQAAERADAGVYTCHAEDAMAPAATTLRVKDMYAALWPFLGICAEVFILCAIILVYEKRRTKPELDDSDTDNHEQ